MADYGDYNGNLTNDEHKEKLDVKGSSATTAIRRTVASNYTNSEIKPGPYVGYVLRIDVKEGSGWLYDWIGADWSVKVRVPELDAHIPEPQKFGPDAEAKDIQRIDLHKSYYPKDGVDMKYPAFGQRVLVHRDETGNKDILLELLSITDGNVEPQKASEGGKSGYKGGAKPELQQKQPSPKPPVSQSEIDKWNAYSRNSGNPLNIDIVTKTINGQKITFSRNTMTKYERMIDLWDSRRVEITEAGLGDIGTLQYKFGEAFRIWRGHFEEGKRTGSQFKNSTKTGTHAAGTAVDISLLNFYKISTNKEYLRNYLNLLISCAQESGFTRFGIGRGTTLHMDTGERPSGQVDSPFWWIYDSSGNTGKTADSKKQHYQRGWITAEWTVGVTRYSAPPSFKDWDYLGNRYGPNTRGVG
jgi:hypothetical protein